jgi:hypothetical protein
MYALFVCDVQWKLKTSAAIVVDLQGDKFGHRVSPSRTAMHS